MIVDNMLWRDNVSLGEVQVGWGVYFAPASRYRMAILTATPFST